MLFLILCLATGVENCTLSGLETCLLLPELRKAITKHLNIVDRGNLSMVNRIAHQALNNELYSKPDLDVEGDLRFYGLSLYNYVRKLDQNSALKIKVLSVIGTNVVARAICEIIDKCQNIEIMKLGQAQLSEELINKSSLVLRNLKELWIENIYFGEYNSTSYFMIKIIASSLLYLEGLFISYPRNLKENQVIDNVFKLKKLKRLGLRGCDCLSDTGIQQLILQCKQIEYLDVSNTKTMLYPTCVWLANTKTKLKTINVKNTRILARGVQILKLEFKKRGLDPEKSVISNGKCSENCPNYMCFNANEIMAHIQSSYQETSIIGTPRVKRSHAH